MKKVFSLIAAVLFVSVLCVGSASAYTFTYTNEPGGGYDIVNNDNSVPGDWYNLNLPTLANAGFVYDSSKVTTFKIDMYGYNDYDGGTIDIWRKATGVNYPYTAAKKMVGFDVVNNMRSFILELNLVDGSLWRNYKLSNGSWTGFVDTNVILAYSSLASFDGLASFDIGYACTFTLDKTVITIEQDNPVPEPTTMLLLGLGLTGIAGLRRKIQK